MNLPNIDSYEDLSLILDLHRLQITWSHAVIVPVELVNTTCYNCYVCTPIYMCKVYIYISVRIVGKSGTCSNIGRNVSLGYSQDMENSIVARQK